MMQSNEERESDSMLHLTLSIAWTTVPHKSS